MTELSREAILAMVPGRELDKLVAEKIMGGELWGPFEPSTDIFAAWEVASKYPLFDIRRIEYFIGNVTHEATLYMNLDDGEERCGASAKTAPEAICKAALLTTLEESK